MRIDDKGLPIHRDARRDPPADLPRGQLLRRRQPRLAAGAGPGRRRRVPINQTSAPVQLDQVLDRSRPTRATTCRCCSASCRSRPGARARAATTARSRTGSPPTRTRRSSPTRCWASRTDDLSATSTTAGNTAAAIDRNRVQLQSLVTDFNTTAAAFAARDQTLVGRGRRAAAHPSRRDARARRAQPLVPGRARPDPRRAPGVRSSGPAIDAACRSCARLAGWSRRRSCAAWPPTCARSCPRSTQLNQHLVPLFEQVSQASSCQNDVVLPWTKDKIEDKPSRRPARSTRRRPSRCPAWPARAARATPTASGSA